MKTQPLFLLSLYNKPHKKEKQEFLEQDMENLRNKDDEIGIDNVSKQRTTGKKKKNLSKNNKKVEKLKIEMKELELEMRD